MTPSIEVPKGKETDVDFSFFTVNLGDEEPFDPQKFESLVNSLNTKGEVDPTLKYLVLGDQMIIFLATIGHDKVYFELKYKYTDAPKSAGNVKVHFARSGQDRQFPRRTINGWSSTLHNGDWLTKFESDSYKERVIASKLGQFFAVR